MARNARHAKILEIISEKEIETQEELCAELSAQGMNVTQATVSRDIKDLRLFKVKGAQKRFRYASLREHEGGVSEKLRALFQACVVRITPVGNLIVVKTLPGSGANAGVVIDGLAYTEVVGSIAGDDTVLLICPTPEAGKSVADRLLALVGA